MEFVVLLGACITTSIVCNVMHYWKSASADMDVSWNEGSKSWNCEMHVSKSINFSKKKKLIIKLNQVKDSRK